MLPHRRKRKQGKKIQFEADEELGAQLELPAEFWWREIKAGGKLNVGAHVIQEGYDEYSAQTIPYGR